MGMQRMFTDQAQFTKFVTAQTGMKVSDVHQRAFIDINEHGTVAAVASRKNLLIYQILFFYKFILIFLEIKFVLLCSGCGPVDFAVNRPFLFLIKDDSHTYFMGRVVDPRK